MNVLKLSKDKEIELFVLCILLFLIRIAIPFVINLFVPYFIFFTAYTLFRMLKDQDVMEFKHHHLRVFSAFLLVCLFFLTGILLSSNLNLSFLKELFTMLVVICFGMMAFTYIEGENDFKILTRKFMRQLLVFCIFICLFGAVKMFFLLREVKFEFLFDYRGLYPRGTSLVIDYNFYALLNLLGIVSAIFFLINEKSVTHILFIQLLIFCLTMNVMFSMSRRGIVALTIVILVLFLVLLFGWIARKGTWLAILSRNIRFTFILFFGFMFLLIVLLSQEPFLSGSSRYTRLGFDRTSCRELLYQCAVKYSSIFDPRSKDTVMRQYFDRFRKTGEVGALNPVYKTDKQGNALDSGISIKFNRIKKGESDDYFKVILMDPENHFSGGRIQRVNYAIKIFSEQYTISKQIIGGGFDYLWDFGHAFYYKNNHRFYFDYPHNPIISAFLYSGILGGLSLVYFFCMTFLNFIRNFKSLIYFICLYAIVFFFAFFSGNSIFGSPEFLFFSLVPFYYTTLQYRGIQKSPVINP